MNKEKSMPRSPSRRGIVRAASVLVALSLMATAVVPVLAEEDPLPPPSNVGTDVTLRYQGPPPSQVQEDPRGRALVGPVKLLRAGTVDQRALTVKLPLYRGEMSDGRSVWYILTDTTDEANAEALGLNHSAKLAYADVGRAVRNATLQEDGTLRFARGAVDFSPERAVTPGDAPNFFPPKSFQPGSVGDADYSPLIRIGNAGGHIYNAPVVAFDVTADEIDSCRSAPDYGRVHDRVLKICPSGTRDDDTFAADRGTVTLQMTPIFSFAKPSAYISTEASDPMVATLDNGTFAPAIGDVPVGGDDGAFSSVERLFPIANGPTGAENPQRQGLNSALSDVGADGKPLPPVHVIGGLPTVALDYSPLWDVNLGEWTDEAIERGYRSRMIDEFQLLEFVRQGWITGPDGAAFGSTGIVVNCPIVMRFL
jgi:hypothetical protein